MSVQGMTANDTAAVPSSRLRIEGEEVSKAAVEKEMADAIVHPAI